MTVHPSSYVSPKAQVAENVEIGPFCQVYGNVKIGAGSKLISHVCLGSETTSLEVGEANVFHPGAVIGSAPQDLKYSGELTSLKIGSRNVFRECATANAGTSDGGGTTFIGSDGLFMAYVHVAHDCKIGDHVVIANSCQLAGHVDIADHVKVGGVCCFNQFVRLGTHSYVAGDSAVNKDILPYSIAQGKYARMRAANQVGMERNGYSPEDVSAVKTSLRWILKGSDTVADTLEKMRLEFPNQKIITEIIEFIESSERGIAL